MTRLIISVPAANPDPEARLALETILEATPPGQLLADAQEYGWSNSELLGELLMRQGLVLDDDNDFDAQLQDD